MEIHRTAIPVDAPLLLRSAALSARGVPHAFTTRHGGVSCGVFASLNFGNPSDLAQDRRDPAANIHRNLRRVLDVIDPLRAAGPREIVEVHQVHGAAVHVVRPGARAHDGPATTRADAVVTDDPARAVGVRIADCAPVLLASADGRVVGAVHAGWRGVIAGVALAAVDAMQALGARDIAGAIGPCIGFDAFEVGPEVAAEFRREFGADTPVVRSAHGASDRARPGKFMVDLKAALREQLEGAGVTTIDVLPHCTVREAELFYSHRREHGITGRMIALIGPCA